MAYSSKCWHSWQLIWNKAIWNVNKHSPLLYIFLLNKHLFAAYRYTRTWRLMQNTMHFCCHGPCKFCSFSNVVAQYIDSYNYVYRILSHYVFFELSKGNRVNKISLNFLEYALNLHGLNIFLSITIWKAKVVKQ